MPTMTELPTLNSELLFALIKWAESDEHQIGNFLLTGRWNQGTWGSLNLANVPPEERRARAQEAWTGACATASCMAGQTALQAGYRINYPLIHIEREVEVHAETCIPTRPTGAIDERGFPVYEDVPGARPESIREVGQRTLGLTEDETNWLFDGDNDVQRLKEVANLLCSVRDLPLLFPFDDVFDPNDWYDDDNYCEDEDED